MFRKPKRKLKGSLRRKEVAVVGGDGDDDRSEPNEDRRQQQQQHNPDDGEEDTTSNLLSEARKRVKMTTASYSSKNSKSISNAKIGSSSSSSAAAKAPDVMHSFGSTNEDGKQKNINLVTSTAQYHPEKQEKKEHTAERTAGKGKDGIFRDQQQNKFHAGPIRCAQHVRVTARFDYQPDVCKDYKETGFCGFGDTCIYLHDRGDTMTGWQLEQQWLEQKKRKKEQQEKDLEQFAQQDDSGNGGGGSGSGQASSASALATAEDDGLPFACFLCREYFKDPVVTTCQHYFCEKCIFNHVRNTSSACPVCKKETHSVFNQPQKLLAKRRKVLGARKAKEENSWEEFAKVLGAK